MDLALEGRVALVTGGSKSVGIRDALVAEGCHVPMCSRDEEEVQRPKSWERPAPTR